MPVTSRARRTIILSLGLVAVFAGLVFFRLWWASLPPTRPKDMPPDSVWIEAPVAPFDFSPRGYWLGCWLDTLRNLNRCCVTDWRGHVEFQDEYKALSGSEPVPQTDLRLRLVDTAQLSTWSDSYQAMVPIALLTDGQILVPTKAYDELRRRFGLPSRK
jgi:hypothetical protein